MCSHHQLNPQFLVDALYCEEQHLDTHEGEGDSFIDINNNNTFNHHHRPLLLEQDLWEDDDQHLASLLQKEQQNPLHGSLEQNPCLAEARGEAVEWMLSVVHYYSFSPLTAVLAVNYLDRFLHRCQPHGEKPWMTQLAAVACISLAAKVEEVHVPLLLDLQVEESKYAFESKTIQRMEILVLSTLKWKMNPVTPLSFLDYIAVKLGLGLLSHISRVFLSRCHCLLLSLLSDCRFMSYLPSALATAAMLYAISIVEPATGVEHQDQLVGILGIEVGEVQSCCALIQEVASRADFFFYSCNKRKFPGSPKGVVDVCFSSDTAAAPHDSPAASVSSSPDHFSKRVKSK